MRLTSIQMSGFKSFVEPTRVAFDHPLTGVVGPNGCGKSNIIDAIRWVLGERARNLRGETLDDIIFDGSDSRKRLDQASVEVVIDNSLGRVGGEYAGFSEIRIRREASRSAESQSRYYINGAHVRRKDVADLFQGTGLGRGNYAVIAQGMVQGLIEAKPDEARRYIEEAAGISLYRERRRETENRIRRAEENLDRLGDILKEHERRLRHLKRQKEQASEQEALHRERRAREGEWVSLQLRERREILRKREETYAEAEKRRDAEEARLKALNESLEAKRAECDATRRSTDDAVTLHQRLLAEATSQEQRIRARRDQRDRSTREIERLDAEIAELEESGKKVREELRRLEEERDRNDREWSEVRAAQEKAEALRAKRATALRARQERSDEIRERIGRGREDRTKEETQLRQYEDELRHMREAGIAVEEGEDPRAALESRNEAARVAWRRRKDLLEENRDQAEKARAELRRREEALAALREDQTRAQGRLASLEALQQASLAGDAAAHAKVLEGMRLQGKLLMDQIKVESGWEFAVETVLAESLGAFCVDELPETFPETRVPGARALTLLDRSSRTESEPDRASLASRVESPFSLVPQLGDVLAVETLEEARAARNSLRPRQSVITRDGVWMGSHWARFPAAEGLAAGALERRREIDSLSGALRRMETESRDLERRERAAEKELREREERRSALQAEYDQAFEAFASSKARLQGWESQAGRLEELRKNVRLSQSRARQRESEIQSLERDRVRAEEARAAAEAVLRESDEDLRRQSEECNRLQLETHTARARIEAHQQRLARESDALRRCRERRSELTRSLASVEEDADLARRLKANRTKEREAERDLRERRSELDRLSDELGELDRERWEANRKFLDLGKDLHDEDLKRREIQGVCEQLLGRLREQELDPEEILKTLPEDAEAARWEAKVSRVLGKLERMPPVNMAAAREYDELMEQKTREEERLGDVREALEKLNRAMARIDSETRERFRRTFGQVNENLKRTFPRIIGEGGEASLVMTDQNPLSAGVEVRARPPGKRYRNMHMLSGGEQAMVAVSLVLSLFLLNPAPFCILDEVDAPLSDDNLSRFCRIVGEMGDRIQFIIVTHNKITMEHVDQLIGVTMHEPGVSRLVSVNVAQAMEMVERAEMDHA